MKRQEPSSVHPDVIKAAAYFRKHRDEIKAAYPDQIVAILDGQVIAVDEDYGRLESFVAKHCPGRHPYLAYSNALLLSEMLERFRIEEPITSKWLEEAEDLAAGEVLRRMKDA